MSDKNDSSNLTENSSGLLKDGWSICLSYFFSCFNSWKATSVYRSCFPAICRVCFSNRNITNQTVIIRSDEDGYKTSGNFD